MLSSGCTGFLASIVDKSKEEKVDLTNVPVVREFMDVFSEKLPRLHLVREISFEIELLRGTGPILKAPYRMAPVELKEL